MRNDSRIALAAGLVLWFAVCFLTAAVGASSSLQAGTFYAELVRPEWAPPAFGWNQGALSFLDIVVLWVLIVATLVFFWRIKPMAGLLLAPYLAWVSFASALNYEIWQLNPSILG